jgi:Ca2+-binding EF-hand superfamily protein
MKQIDMEHHKQKIHDSFKYFDTGSPGVEAQAMLRVLKRTHPFKEEKFTAEIEKYKNEYGNVSYEGIIKIAEFFLPR